MKTKVKEALKTMYVNLGLGDKALDGVAGMLIASKTITDESQIATVIAGAEIKDLLTSIQSEGDKARQDKASLQKQFDDYKVAHPEAQPDPNPAPKPGEEPPKPSENPAKDDLKTVLGEFLSPIIERLNKVEAEKASANKLQEAVALRDALGLDIVNHKNWVDDAWALATSTVAEQDTPQSIVDRFKTRFDGTMKMLGANGYAPAPGSAGPPKSKIQETMDKLKAESSAATDGSPSLKSKVAGVVESVK